jgi:hypothetical protein
MESAFSHLKLPAGDLWTPNETILLTHFYTIFIYKHYFSSKPLFKIEQHSDLNKQCNHFILITS